MMNTPMEITSMAISAIHFTIPIFCVATMLAMGLDVTLAETLAPLRQLLALGIIILVNNVFVPLVGFVIVAMPEKLGGSMFAGLAEQLVPLAGGRQIGFLLLFLAAGNLLGPVLARIANTTVSCAKGVMIVLVVVSAVLAPFELSLLCNFRGVSCQGIESSPIFMTLLIYQLLPLAAGITIKTQYEPIAMRLRPVITMLTYFAFFLLLALLVPAGQGVQIAPENVGSVQSLVFTTTVTMTSTDELSDGIVSDELKAMFAAAKAPLPTAPRAEKMDGNEKWVVLDAERTYFVEEITFAPTPDGDRTNSVEAITTAPTPTESISGTESITDAPTIEPSAPISAELDGDRTNSVEAITTAPTPTLSIAKTNSITVAFSITSTANITAALDARRIDDALRNEFLAHDLLLPADLVVVISSGNKWVLTATVASTIEPSAPISAELDAERTYFVEAITTAPTPTLSIAKTNSITVAFSITSTANITAALDARRIDDALRNEFLAHGLLLPADLVVVISSGNKWVLTVADKTYFVKRIGDEPSDPVKLEVSQELTQPPELSGELLKALEALPSQGIGPLVSLLQKLVVILLPYAMFVAVAGLLMLIGNYGGVAVRNVVGASGTGIPRALATSTAARNVSMALILARFSLDAVAVVLIFYLISLIVTGHQAVQWGKEAAPPSAQD